MGAWAMTGNATLENSGNIAQLQIALPLTPTEALSATAQGNTTPAGNGTSSGNVVISLFGELILALTNVLLQNAAIFKETAAQAAARIQSEAEQQAAAASKQFLTAVANALQKSSETGQLPQLASVPTPSFQAYSRTGQPAPALPATSIPTPAPSDSISQLFMMLAHQAKAAGQS
jgi:hypothetical protein